MSQPRNQTIPGFPQYSFALGEITPRMAGRADIELYHRALSTCRNLVPCKYGGVDNRAGTEFVALVDDSAQFHRLIKFDFNNIQQYALSFGNYTMSVIAQAAVVVSGIVTPWASADLPLLKFTPSADIITVCHPNYPTYQIERLSATNWQIVPFAPVNGPFQDINVDETITVTTTDVTGSITVNASKALFSADMVGLEFYMQAAPDNTTPIWEVQKSITAGEIVMYGANYYQAATTGTTGTYAPVVLQGSQKDGHDGVLWNYLHSGFGIVQIKGYIDTKTVTANVVSRLPDSLVQANMPVAISAITPGVSSQFGAASVQVNVETLTAHGLTTGDRATIANVEGSIGTYVNKTCTVAVNTTTNFDIVGNYASGSYVADTGQVAAASAAAYSPSYLWALPEWGTTKQGYPGTTAYFQDRQIFGGDLGNPFKVIFSTTEGFNDFTVSNPVLDTDAITYKILSNEVNAVKYFLGLQSLLIFHSGGVEMVQGGNTNGVITPASVNLVNQGANPCGDVRPLKIDNYALFVQSLGNQVRSLGYSWAENAFIGEDVTTMSSHLFTFNTILDWDYQEIPDSVVWAIRNDGTLLSLTWVPKQQITAWAHHDTVGTFESVCVVNEPNPLTGLTANMVYFIVNRPGIGRCIERMNPRQVQDTRDYNFVDCGLSFDSRNDNTGVTWTLQYDVIDDTTGKEIDDTLGRDLIGALPIIFTTLTSQFASTDVGSAIVIADSTGKEVYLFIESYVSPEQVVVSPSCNVPEELQNTSVTGYVMVRNTFSGAGHLAGQTCALVADGKVYPQFVMPANGEFTLPEPACVVHVGLPFTSDFETCSLASPRADIRDKQKLVNNVSLILDNSAGFMVGPDTDHLMPLQYDRLNENYDVAGDLITGLIDMPLQAMWKKDGRVFIRQSNPLPLSILAAIPQVGLGGH